ncbi:MAG: hypothetical protein IPM39_29385 [Chloroflexi bacterium]|nr:hypothetical protein [Chloroflexota bacterium]
MMCWATRLSLPLDAIGPLLLLVSRRKRWLRKRLNWSPPLPEYHFERVKKAAADAP